ncbi:tape measure protein [Marinivivus vitaminiproducens]|uniref:tape measure protein n=1 Tax=Marinivivus vitaminiproducens TaxID=3035935 RepID=UPI0027A4F78F|nr:tape measure protein [Geminicoccaceae bacterium SCSIO 64248]
MAPTRAVAVRLAINGDEQVKSAFRQIGQAGDRAFTEIANDAQRAGRSLADIDREAKRAEAAIARVGRAGIGGMAANVDSVVAGKVGALQAVAARAAGPALAVAGGAYAAKGVIDLADGYATLAARLQLATEATGDYVRVEAELARSAIETGSALEGNVALFTSIARNREDLGESNERILEFVDSLSKLAVVSGSTAAEYDNAARQIAQALGSGVLRGDEFNSVAEQMGEVLPLIARELGVTTGELRGMAEQGEITAKVLIDSVVGAAGEIDDRFSRLPATAERAAGGLRTAFTRVVGIANQTSGATAGITEAIEDLTRIVQQPAFQSVMTSTFEFAAAAGRDVVEVVRAITEDLDWLFEKGRSIVDYFDGEQLDTVVGEITRTTDLLRKAEEDLAGMHAGTRPNLMIGGPIEAIQSQTEHVERLRAELAKLVEERDRLTAKPIEIEIPYIKPYPPQALEEQHTAAVTAVTQRTEATVAVEKAATDEVLRYDREQREAHRRAMEMIEPPLPKPSRELIVAAAGKPITLSETDSEIDATEDRLRDLERQAQGITPIMEDIRWNVESAFDGLGRVVADSILESKLELEDLNDLAKDFMADMIQMSFRRAVTGPALNAIFGAPAYHSGGVVGEASTMTRYVNPLVFAVAPRMHLGGLAGDEVPTILQRGERVLNREQTRAYDSRQAPKVVVQVNNHTDSKVDVRTAAGPDGQQTISLTIEREVNAMAGDGRLTGAMAQYGARRQPMGR